MSQVTNPFHAMLPKPLLWLKLVCLSISYAPHQGLLAFVILKLHRRANTGLDDVTAASRLEEGRLLEAIGLKIDCHYWERSVNG